MAKPKRKRKKPGPGHAPPSAEAILAELATRAGEITEGDPDAAGPAWGAVHKLLLKTKADPTVAASIIATRDTAALDRLVRGLRGEEVATPAEPGDTDAAGDVPDVPIEVRRKAMRAFRKRLKLIRLDHESRLGVGPMTGGKKADFDAIMPPQEYDRDVWNALVADGKLRAAGPGFYMLAEEETAE